MTNHNHHHHKNCQNGLKKAQVVVVMVPFPAQGHLNQLLQLSRLVASYNIPVHYVGSTTHNHQAKLRAHSWNPNTAANIQFHEFPTPCFLSPPPDPKATLKFPSHLQPSFDSMSLLRKPVAALLRTLSHTSRRLVIIHDSLMGSVVQEVTSLTNAESFTFHSVSAFTMFFYFWESMGRPFTIDAEYVKDVPSLEDCFTPEFAKFIKAQHDYSKFSSGRLYNTCRDIEGPFIELLAREQISKNKKEWALGPFNPVTIRDERKSHQRHKCLKWLDKKEPKSVIYVSFGTTSSFTNEQIKELALGLEKSEQQFILVLRDADKGDVFVGGERKFELPKGFEERVEGRGIVVREWAPQLEILGHPSVGGFMSHCGWNSCMESITMGVPIAAWPMHSDQPRNTVLITKFLKIGIVVKDWARRGELVNSLTVESAVKSLMATEEGDGIRTRAAELGDAVRRSVEEGGVSRRQLDSFIAHISR